MGRLLADEEEGDITRVDSKIVRRMLAHLLKLGKITVLEMRQPSFAGRPILIKLVTKHGLTENSPEVQKHFAEVAKARHIKEEKADVGLIQGQGADEDMEKIHVAKAPYKEERYIKVSMRFEDTQG